MKPLDSSFCSSLLIILLSLGSCSEDKVGTSANQVKELPSIVSKSTQRTEILTDTNSGQNAEISLIETKTDSLDRVGEWIDSTYAYGLVKFGMSKKEVEVCNAKKQRLLNFTYEFNYSFNHNGQLYAIYLNSEPEKAIYYETRLQSKYGNLCRIISEKYGNQKKCGQLPSIFDVMNSKTLYLATWRLDHKLIQLGITQVDLNGYKVLCKISNPAMEKEAKHQEYLKKNKKLINAADKF